MEKEKQRAIGRKLQDLYHEEVGQHFGLGRGEVGSRRKNKALTPEKRAEAKADREAYEQAQRLAALERDNEELRARIGLLQRALQWCSNRLSAVYRNSLQTWLRDKLDLRLRSGVEDLLRAAAKGRVEAVRALLSSGIKPDDLGPSGETALMRAAGAGEQHVVAVLLEAGADPACWDNDGCTAADHARNAGHLEMADDLDAASGTVRGSNELSDDDTANSAPSM